MELYAKSETVDPEVRAYVYSLITAIGGADERGIFRPGDEASAVLKDIRRWLRLYDEKTGRLDVKRCLAEGNIVKGDLLEILSQWPEDGSETKLQSKLALGCLELLVPLTWPLEMDMNDDAYTVNTHRHLPFLQLAQVGYKRAVLQHDYSPILRIAVRVGLPSMVFPRRERKLRDEGIIKLMLYFVRNISMIAQPQHLPSQGDENDISRTATVDAFHKQDIFQLLLTIGSGTGDEFIEQDVILLEILFHLLKGVDAKKLFMEKKQLANAETQELRNLIQKEKAMLSGYNKTAPTRHNRFGTMIWVRRDDAKYSTVTGQNTITDETSTLHSMDTSKRWNRPKYRGKMTQEFEEQSDFGMQAQLTEAASRRLRSFVEDFLDSSFNPLFSHLRRAIERDADRLQHYNRKQYFYLISWFLSASFARRDRTRAESGRNADRPTQVEPQENSFAYIAAVLDQETFILLNRSMQRAFDEKLWQDLQATLLCFTQILLTVQTMTASPDEGDQEIAENIQSRIFYEEATHDRLTAILRGYTNQGFSYLDAVTECVHVFVRMLERYSKQNVDLHIRSKHRARTKRKQQTNEDYGEEQADAEGDEREAHRAVSERKFDFARFATKFTTQPCVNTFLALLHFYHDLSPAQLTRCHRYFYRVAFKQELCVLLFRVDILLLFQQMIKGRDPLSKESESFKEWETLVQQIFRRNIKWLERPGMRETAVQEMLFSKIPATVYYLQFGYEREVIKRPPRPPAELEVKPGMEKDGQIGVAASLLIDTGKADALSWVKRLLERAVDERKAWDDEHTARQSLQEPEETDELAEGADKEKSAPPTILLVPDSDARKEALFKDKHLRLLLNVLGFERLGATEDPDASWIIPSSLTTGELKAGLDSVKKTEFSPPTYEDGKSAADHIRPKCAARAALSDGEDSDIGTGSGDEIDDALFPAGGPTSRAPDNPRPKKRKRLTRRNRVELTDEQREERALERNRREREKNSKIKSALFITASDDEDDEEGDAEFFRLEEERRVRMRGVIRNALLNEAEADGWEKAGKKPSKGGRKRKIPIFSDLEESDEGNDALLTPLKPPKRSRQVASSEEDVVMDDSSDASSAISRHSSAPPELSLAGSTDDDAPSSDGEETLSSSPTLKKATASPAEPLPKPLMESSANIQPAIDAGKSSDGGEDSEDEVDPFAKRPLGRRNVRAGFILNDSDDE